jgi:hypothetical protein
VRPWHSARRLAHHPPSPRPSPRHPQWPPRLLDTAGSFVFTGQSEPDGVSFEWKDGEEWKRFRITRRPDGSQYSRYDAHVPAGRPFGPIDATFEGVSRPVR